MLHRKRIYLVDGVLFSRMSPCCCCWCCYILSLPHRLNILFIDHIVCGAHKTNLRFVRSLLYSIVCVMRACKWPYVYQSFSRVAFLSLFAFRSIFVVFVIRQYASYPSLIHGNWYQNSSKKPCLFEATAKWPKVFAH